MSAFERENLLMSANSTQDCSECRICLLKIEMSWAVKLLEPWPTPWYGMKSTVAEDLYSLSNIQITHNDLYSKVICVTCCEKLRNANEIVRLAQNNNEILTRRKPKIEINVSSESAWPKPIQLDKSVAECLYENPMDVEVKQELLSEGEELNTPEFKDDYSNTEIKIEPEEISIPDHSTNLSLEACSIPLSNYEQMNGGTNGISYDEEYLDSIKEEPIGDGDADHAEGSFDLPLECLLCSKQFNTVSGLKAHVIAQHSYKSVKRRAPGSVSPAKKRKTKYTCTTCKRSFVTSTDLMVHETCHSKLACYICNEKFDTFDQLSNHRKKCRVSNANETNLITLNDVKGPAMKEIMHCPTCCDKFSDPYYLKIHQEAHHSSPSEGNELPVKEKKIETKDEMKDSLAKLNETLEGTPGKSNEIESSENGSTEVDQQKINVNIEVEKVLNVKIEVGIVN